VHKFWMDEIWRIAGIVLLGGFVGFIAGHPGAGVLVAIGAYLAWHLYNLFRLDRWLRAGGRDEPPVSSGVWGEVYHTFYLFRRRYQERSTRLSNALEEFQSATRAMPDAAAVLNAAGELVWFNAAAVRLLGLNATQDVGQPIVNLVRHPRFASYLELGDYSAPLEIEFDNDAGTTLLIHVIPYGNDQRLLVARDVSQRKRLEQMRRDFVANVSHELRTPLTVISGYLETMADDAAGGTAEPWGRFIGLMQEQSGRMLRIVEDLLLLARLEADRGEPARDPVSVPSLLAGLREEATAVARSRGHSIELDAEPGLWVTGNEQQLRSAFSNLIYNAIRYTPEPGVINIRWTAHQGGARLDVSDTGIGIAAQHIPRLTERFYRVDVGRSREAGGTGLGLAIVKHVLNRHQAQLEIESKPGSGSTFSCLFPASVILHHRPAASGQQQH